MSWQTVKLGELGEFRNGLNYSRANEGFGLKVISVKNFGDLRVPSFEELDEINPNGLNIKNSLLEAGDIIFVRSNGNKDLIGRTMFIESKQENVSFSGFCIRFRNTSDIARSKFLAYYFRSPIFRRTLSNLGGGTNINNLNQVVLHNFPISLPMPEQQDRILAVLSAYDDLIENNRRRVGLLEQAARLLYREWFVHFRFPGHETATFVDGLPEGWETRVLSDLCTARDGIQTGPFGSQLHQSDYSETGVPVVMPKDLKGNKVDCETIARIPEQLADKLGRHRMTAGDTVYGRRGDIGRRAFIGKRQNGFFCGTGCLRIRPDPEQISPRYLYEMLGSPQTAGFIANQAKGSTMPNLSAGALKNVPIVCAPKDLQDSYEKMADAQFEAIEILDDQIVKLTRARDLLLPRLMDGRIPV